MSEKVLKQEEIDTIIQNLETKKNQKKKNEKLTQKEIDKVIKDFEALTNTDLSQDDIDYIIKTFDQEYKPE